ncbi:MAG: hypothetical protein HGB33_09160 [Syntrophaceae bacterium]|nr:hypothetical protein [Syntrophaceae bacterium]
MDNMRITKEMIALNKTVFNDYFIARNALYEQTARLMNKFWEKSPMFPENGRKVVFEWMRNYKIGCESFKNIMNENFKQLEDISDKST